MPTDCNLGIEIPTLIEDVCNGCRYDTKCVYRELPSTVLDIAANKPLEDYIVALISAIQSLTNRVEELENAE